MSFFNSKEETLKVQLTERGKYLLSKGIFYPKYYGFFDDDVIYDIKYAGLSEEQNDIQDRILDNTCYLKPQVNFSSVFDKTSDQLDKFDRDGNKESSDVYANNDGMQNIIGTSDFNLNYVPAWSVNIISGEIKSHVSENNKDNQLKITQINLSNAEESYYSIPREEDISEITDELINPESEEEDYIFKREVNLMNVIEVFEKNSSDKIKNFNIEIFVEEENKWKQLRFIKDRTNIQNNILLDEEINSETQNINISEDNVEYYFEILLDNDVELPEDKKQNLENIYRSNIDDSFRPFGNKCNV